MLNSYSTAQLAATLCGILGVPAPAYADKNRLAPLTQFASRGSDAVPPRLLIYDPDAVALWLWQKYPDLFLPVMKHTQLALPMRTVMPSVTPVCFGTIYTGALPEVHGIMRYEKPVIRIDTFFDALIRAGRRPVIYSTTDCSMSRIFLGRDMDYVTVDGLYCFDAAMREFDAPDASLHDVVIVYEGNYDAVMHREGVNSEAALNELKLNADHFDRLVTRAMARWAGRPALYGWVTDHGCHDTEIGRGTHGTDLEDDLNVIHFWGKS